MPKYRYSVRLFAVLLWVLQHNRNYVVCSIRVYGQVNSLSRNSGLKSEDFSREIHKFRW